MVFFGDVAAASQVNTAYCRTHAGHCPRKPPDDGRDNAGCEGPPCILFALILHLDFSAALILLLFFSPFFCVSISESGPNILGIRMGHMEGLSNLEKRKVHDVWVADKKEQKLFDLYWHNVDFFYI